MMKRFSIKPDETLSPQESRQRISAIWIHIITGALLTLASAPSLLTLTPEPSLNYVGNIITFVMGLISFACAWISLRFSYIRGSLLFTISILLISLGIPFYANGLGLQAGIIVAVIVISVAATTLPAAQAVRIGIIAVALEAGVILADLFLPEFGLGELESETINPFTIAIVLAFTYSIFRQFASYTFRAKLILVFVTVTAFTVSVVAISISTVSRTSAIQQSGNTVSELANRLALDIGNSLIAELNLLEVAGTHFEEGAAETNNSYGSKNDSQILASINTLDSAWQSAEDSDRVIQNILGNEYSTELREFQKIAPQHVEVFITDRYGANFASTNRTSDYYQADEEWWQAAYNGGEGAIYISQPQFDASSNTFALLIALPLYHEDELVGVLRSTLNVNAVAQTLTRESITNIVLADLRVSQDQLLSNRTLSEAEIAGLNGLPPTFGELPIQGIQSLVSERKVFVEAGNEAEKAVSDLNWSVIVHQDLNIALQPIEDQTRVTVVVSMAALILAALLGYVAAQRLATPIVSLRNVTSRIAKGNLDARAEINTQDEIGALSDSFNEMAGQLQGTLRGLEERVAERTAALNASRVESESRAQDLHSISEISRIISTEQKLDTLLPLITRLVSEKFEFYHTGIFLLDDSRRFAVLQAANSEGGQRMLARAHKLEAGHGIVGTVVLEGKPRIALDVGTDAVYFDNPDLPNTRSEMALPLQARDQIIGALDVQSTNQGEFTDNDLNILGILADQIAIAIENARLFEKSEQAYNEIQNVYTQYLQREWKALQSRTTAIGYRQSLQGGAALETPVQTPEIQKALIAGETLVTESNGSQTEPTIVVPINLRGQTIGVLNVKSSAKNRKWSQEEINLIQSVTDRLAIALENARLFEETNRRAERERLVTEITGKIRSVNDPQAMIAMAAEELKNILGASRVQVVPQTKKENGQQES